MGRRHFTLPAQALKGTSQLSAVQPVFRGRQRGLHCPSVPFSHTPGASPFMLPILFKLQFDGLTSKIVYLVLAAAFVAYGAWAGLKNAEKPEHRLWRAIPFGLTAVLAMSLAPVWAFPVMSSSLAGAIKALVWGSGILLTISAALYGFKAAPAGKSPMNEALSYGAMGAAATALAVKFGLSGEMGRNTGLPLHTYGLMIATAFLLAIALGARTARRTFPETLIIDGKEVPGSQFMFDKTLDIGFWMLISGILGAKLLFVIVNWDRYSRAPMEAFSLSGGLVFYGGFIGSALTLIAYCRRYELNFLRLADTFAPSLAIGHMIGRIGCLAAGCCWGGFAKAGSKIALRFPSAEHLPFGGFGSNSLAFSDQLKDTRWVDAMGHIHEHAVTGATQISAYAQANGYTLPVYPTQLMEIVGELCIFCVLMFFMNRKRFHGQILATWLMGYAILRTINEFFRGDVARGYLFQYPAENPVILSTSQTIALGLFLTGLTIVIVQVVRKRKSNSSVPAPA